MGQGYDVKWRIQKNSDGKIAWEDDAERLILYVDIMGFSHRVTYTNHGNLKKELQAFKHTWESKIKPLEKGGYLDSVEWETTGEKGVLD